jgi:hypothetical protein
VSREPGPIMSVRPDRPGEMPRQSAIHVPTFAEPDPLVATCCRITFSATVGRQCRSSPRPRLGCLHVGALPSTTACDPMGWGNPAACDVLAPMAMEEVAEVAAQIRHVNHPADRTQVRRRQAEPDAVLSR